MKKVTVLTFNYKKALTLLFLLFITLSISKAQQNPNLAGKVIDFETRNKVPNAVLEVYQGKNLLFSVITNLDGSFVIPSKFWNENSMLKVTGINYYDLIIPVKDFKFNKEEGVRLLGDIEIKPKPINLKEVLVKARKRYRDTTVIPMSDQVFERSVMIDDIFAQKGLYKGSNGQLYYKGKLVSEIVVNGSEFFGKNNLKVYDKIPALILDNIEVTETNIDSITNTTLLSPEIKVNLKIKEKYNKGKFGSITNGLGTKKRHMYNFDIYTYRKQQQISLVGSANNIGIQESLGEPTLGFSAGGNNSTNKYLLFTYRNVLSKKIDVNFQSKVSQENRDFFYESERTEKIINQVSTTRSSSLNKLLKIDNIELKLNYRLDSLNSILYSTNFNYSNNNLFDSLSYYIQSVQSTKQSLVLKERDSYNRLISSHLVFNKRFYKAGRLLQATFDNDLIHYGVGEVSSNSETQNNSLINGSNYAEKKGYSIVSSFTEPLNEDSFMKFNGFYKKDVLYYSSNTGTSSNSQIPTTIQRLTNNYLQLGFDLQKTFHKTSFDGIVNAISLSRNINYQNRPRLLNLDINLKFDYRKNSNRNFSLLYNLKPNYPNINQLTNINTSYDLISRISGNIELKPESQHRLSFNYNYSKSDSLKISFSTEINYYTSRFGFNSIIMPNEVQRIIIDNVGHAKAGNIMMLVVKTFPKIGSFNYNINFNYNELPNVVNMARQQTNGATLTQTISTTRSIKSNKFIVSPSLTFAYSRYIYNNSVQSSVNFSYSDKYSINLANFEVGIFPFVNVIGGISNKNLTWAVSSEIRKKILKKYGVVWFKANDIFNSFNYQFNNFGPSFTQTVRYSNLSTYFLLGLSYKLNNIK
ncbi:hypothetical protein MUGA111182_04180 [Mucilaginibacter galii]|uniref:Collagen-binding protein n=1 Tax=Mucilaginibacter galii TaxID=2005073 RepID=A0A917J949_9SPHI|nr:hypothetical protein [Mucilaginibacter galii]GGI50919.1 collagen-binding protein [Mucilaginibacter galii]